MRIMNSGIASPPPPRRSSRSQIDSGGPDFEPSRAARRCRKTRAPIVVGSEAQTTEKIMSQQNFTTTLSVDQSPDEVFDAVNDVRAWWSEEIDGRTDELGAEFKFRYQELHRSTQKITEWVPGKRVVWHVSDSHLSFVDDQKEWDGTDVVFEIARKGGKTELRFTHVGLVPAIECYGECSGAWGFYINDSLLGLITTGKGQPNRRE
jgi:hypothetical protein